MESKKENSAQSRGDSASIRSVSKRKGSSDELKSRPSAVLPKPKKRDSTKTTTAGTKKLYSLMGELEVTSSPAPMIRTGEKSFKTPEFLVDGAGNAFVKTSLEVTIDGRRAIAVVPAEAVELILKILQIVKYVD